MRRIALQLVSQLNSETPEDMVAAFAYAQELVEGWVKVDDRPAIVRLHSIRNRAKGLD